MPDKKYDPAEIEPKWQKEWEKIKLNVVDIETAKKPFFNLMMFPYPSAEGMHVGNMYAFTAADVFGRYKRLQGFDVFEPIGLDGFGIHSENYALKVGRHPREHAAITEKNFYAQLHKVGNMYDWTRTVETYDPEYYRWTQWVFVQMFKAGLAYRGRSKVNFCPKDKTVLSDEQVIDGKCERCGAEVEKREMEQWFFRITNYADRLLANLETLDWSEKVRVAQKNWIGKSQGAEIVWKVADKAGKETGEEIVTFTTRTDTIPGVTFIVVSPESSELKKLITKVQEQQCEKYIAETKGKEQDLQEKVKTGVFTGSYAVNPFNGKIVPVYIADYVLSGYGTGVVMGMPGHDERDRDFSKVFDLPTILTTKLPSDFDSEQVYSGEGDQINSGKDYDDLSNKEAGLKILRLLEKNNTAKPKTQYHLRDWLISRQRYWGPPIPMILCPKCDWQPVPEAELPVVLPEIADYQPEGNGKGPLAKHKEFYKTTCPKCGGPAERETDVSDTFLDSAWYELRYPSLGLNGSVKKEVELPWNDKATARWLPVAMYTGGAEHSNLHLMYFRFVSMVMHDLGYLPFEEPATKFFAHGMIIKDGAKMSKSKGNVVNPDEYIAKYGADALRLYLMFMGPVDQGGDFRDTGMQGMRRWVERVWRLVLDQSDKKTANAPLDYSSKLKVELNKLITKANSDFEARHYNTVISTMMQYINLVSAANAEKVYAETSDIKKFLLVLLPFAPHLVEELWQELSGKKSFASVHRELWPQMDTTVEKALSVILAIMVNGKTRGTVEVSGKDSQNQGAVEELAMSDEKIKKHLDGKTIKKVVFVPGKVLNFVTD